MRTLLGLTATSSVIVVFGYFLYLSSPEGISNPDQLYYIKEYAALVFLLIPFTYGFYTFVSAWWIKYPVIVAIWTFAFAFADTQGWISEQFFDGLKKAASTPAEFAEKRLGGIPKVSLDGISLSSDSSTSYVDHSIAQMTWTAPATGDTAIIHLPQGKVSNGKFPQILGLYEKGSWESASGDWNNISLDCHGFQVKQWGKVIPPKPVIARNEVHSKLPVYAGRLYAPIIYINGEYQGELSLSGERSFHYESGKTYVVTASINVPAADLTNVFQEEIIRKSKSMVSGCDNLSVKT